MDSSAEDDLFGSLGSSLMRDLLSDIEGATNTNSTSTNTKNDTNKDGANLDLFNAISRLEKELDATTSDQPQPPGSGLTGPPGISSTTAPPPGEGFAPPGLVIPSAGAIVVDHASISSPAPTATTTTNTSNDMNSNNDAWDHALSQFSALSLTEDFLKADSARKQINTTTSTTKAQDGEDAAKRLFQNTNSNSASVTNKHNNGILVEDYDIDKGPTLSADITGKDMAGFFRGVGGNQSNMNNSNSNNQVPVTTSTSSSRPTPKKAEATVPPQPQPTSMPFSIPSNAPNGGPSMNMMPSHGQPQIPPQQMMQMMQMQGRGGPPPHMAPPPHHPPGVMPPPPPQMVPMHPMMRQAPPHAPPMPGPFAGMAPPPHIQHQHAMMMQQQQMAMQQGGNVPNNHSQQQGQPQQVQQPSKELKPKKEKKVLNQKDFPPLGGDLIQTNEENKSSTSSNVSDSEDELNEVADEKNNDNQLSSTSTTLFRRTVPRITFRNPSPNAPSIPATSIECTSMTPRDLCYVLHSMMRPILTFSSQLDAYNADYYRWSYDDRKSRNLLFLGGGSAAAAVAAAATGNNLPNPVWKETKVKALEMEQNLTEKVEKRSSEWSKEKHILGKSVKVNVKRPRALLATTTLSTAVDGKVRMEDSSSEIETEEDRQRAHLWASRLASDKGYLAYLNLVELRRLLQSRPSDSMGGNDEIESRREELLLDVEENVSKLHAAFGVKKIESGEQNHLIEVDRKILERTLSLPKGRMLLSRVVDEGILPHPSACHVLPTTLQIIFETSLTTELNIAPPPGEDRLLRSLTGLVQTVQPSVDEQNLLNCVSNIINAKTKLIDRQITVRSVLSGKRTLMELLHAVLSRGPQVCSGGDIGDQWKAKEADLLVMLAGDK